MVYTSDSPACALLETCVHIAVENAPPSFTLLRIIGPEVTVDEIPLIGLPPNWMNAPVATQHLGAEWLQSNRSALLCVPSVMVPETWNYLLNPRHPDAEFFQIERSYVYPFDLRLKA
jgi:RES domain-containing protein